MLLFLFLRHLAERIITFRPAAPDFVSRALRMLESIGWIAAHRFLFSRLRLHLLGWPGVTLAPARAVP
jgi:hypothetical protein